MELELLSEVTIWQTQNGYIIKVNKEDEESIDRNIVIQKKPTEWVELWEFWTDHQSEQEALAEVFEILQDYFGVYYSKHNDTYLKVEVAKQ